MDEFIGTSERGEGILKEEVTGAESLAAAPDGLFYTEFSEEEAKYFFGIFQAAKDSYLYSAASSIENLRYNLGQQISSSARKAELFHRPSVCPIEVVLYASRILKKEISVSGQLFYTVCAVIAEQLSHPDAPAVVRNVLYGWDWSQQQSILIEAVGHKNDPSLIAEVLKAYPILAKRCTDNEKREDRMVLLSCVKMLVSAQSEKYFGDIANLVTDPVFVSDVELTEKFLSICRADPFLHRPAALETLRRAIGAHETPETAALCGRIGSVGVPLRAASVAGPDLGTLEFGDNSRDDIRTLKNAHDKTRFPELCRLIMENIRRGNIYPPRLLGEAYVLLGTKGRVRNASEDALLFLQAQRSADPAQEFPILLALYVHDRVDQTELLDCFFNGYTRHRYWGDVFVSYLRYNRPFVAAVPAYLLRKLSGAGSRETTAMLRIFWEILEKFNGGTNNYLGTGDVRRSAFPGKLLGMLESIDMGGADVELYNEVLEILALLLRGDPIDADSALNYLDGLRRIAAASADPAVRLNIVSRIDSLIEKEDTYGAPD